MNLEQIKEIIELFDLVDKDLDNVTEAMQSLKRDEQFLEAATGTWVSSIGMNRSVQPDDKADPS